MEQALPVAIPAPLTRRPGWALRLPLIARILSILIMMSVMMIFGICTVSRSASLPSNPMMAYADVFPGKPRSAVLTRGFSCSTLERDADNNPIREYCVLSPTVGAFTRVETAVMGNTVRFIKFIFRENTCRLGDLILLMGEPDRRLHDNLTYLAWDRTGVIATGSPVPRTKHIPHSLFLDSLSFRDAGFLNSGSAKLLCPYRK